jgi:hypothetical protein
MLAGVPAARVPFLASAGGWDATQRTFGQTFPRRIKAPATGKTPHEGRTRSPLTPARGSNGRVTRSLYPGEHGTTDAAAASFSGEAVLGSPEGTPSGRGLH